MVRSVLAICAVLALLGCGSSDGDDPPEVDYDCQSDSDCAIKDIGNCCGENLRCVASSFSPDPEAVRKFCADNNLSSVCGYPAVDACACVERKCVSD